MQHQDAPKPENLLEYLERNELATKIIDIALAQTMTPYHLRDDAGQDIRVMWMSKTPDVERFERSQIAAYAHQMARHSALRCRRELGSAVRLPGSAFRKKKDGSTYVQPGTIAKPLDWDEMDEWLSLDDQPDANSAGMRTGAECEGDDLEAAELEEVAQEEEENERRHEVFLAATSALTRRGRDILEKLLAGQTLAQIQAELQITPAAISREITRVKAAVHKLGLSMEAPAS